MTANHTATAPGTSVRTMRGSSPEAKNPHDSDRRQGLTTSAARSAFGHGVVSAEDVAAAEAFDLPGADLSSEEITEQVLPAQADEFTCVSCFLVRHRSQIARRGSEQLVCTDCAA